MSNKLSSVIFAITILGCHVSSLGYVTNFQVPSSRGWRSRASDSTLQFAPSSIRLREKDASRRARLPGISMLGTDANSFCTLILQVVSHEEDGGRSVNADELSELLMETGALSVVVEDADRGTEQELPIFNEHGRGDSYWSRCNVTAFYPYGWDIPAVLDLVVKSMDLPVVPRYAVDEVRDQDWVKLVQQSWKPILIDDLLLRFPWHSKEDIAAVVPPDGRVRELMLEGGMAFGTGEHPTTRLCCTWLQRSLARAQGQGMRVMDYGAGSGVGEVKPGGRGSGFATGSWLDEPSLRRRGGDRS
eukprot:764948-Hanusia_phi.AAC.1